MHGNPQATEPDAQTPPTPRDSTPSVALSARPAASVTEQQLRVALTWVNRGALVVPCSRTDKGALVAGFGARATPEDLAPFGDAEQVRAWWSGRFKRAHVGLLCGRGTVGGRGLLVVDLDVSKPGTTPPAGRWAGCRGGSDVLELLAREAGADWPDTYTVATPSGGLHLYFRQPDDGPVIGCATGDGPAGPHLGPLVDVRGVGGYVIAAGSFSAAQGSPYGRVSAPGLGPQPLPGWLLESLRRPAPERPRAAAPVRSLPTSTRAERYAAGALKGAAEDVAGAPEGRRNDALFLAARHLGELAATAPAVLVESVVRDQLVAAAVAAGLDERRATATVRSGWTRGTSAPVGGAA